MDGHQNKCLGRDAPVICGHVDLAVGLVNGVYKTVTDIVSSV